VRPIGVDPACYDLADHFLVDVKGHVTEEDRTEFAELLQRCCEDFVSDWDEDDNRALDDDDPRYDGTMRRGMRGFRGGKP